MNNYESQILAMIDKGEGIDIEFKECAYGLNRSVYESVCAFLNRHGGTILLGVQDSGRVTGIDVGTAAQIRKDFVTAINNPQKLQPPAYLSVDEVVVNGNNILRIYVPESSQVHRCNGRIYDRNEDGDLDITNHTRQVADLYRRKQASYSENKIYPFAKLDDLDRNLIAKCRKVAVLRREDHPWRDLDDLELLKSAQLYQTDLETGRSGLTLAGLLLLGNRSLLLSAVPHHRTDLIVRRVNLDRYDDRDFVDENLIESYDRIMAFIAKHLPDPFYLENTTSISIRDTIFREVASNILIHREYINAFPCKLIIEGDQVRTENSNKPHGFGVLNQQTFTPFPKNPVIAAFFRQIGRADELGSGMRNLMKYGKSYGGADPQMIEGDIFRIVVKVPKLTDDQHNKDSASKAAGLPVAPEVAPEVTPEVTPEVLRLLTVITGEMTRGEIQAAMGLRNEKHFRKKYQQIAVKLGLIEMTIPEKPTSRRQKYRLTAKGRTVIKASHHQTGICQKEKSNQ